MGELVDTAKALAAPAEKLIEAISNGIGTLYEPHKIRKLADAEAYRIGVLAEAVSQNDNLPIAYENGEVQIDAKSFEELQKRAAARFVHQETRRQYNIESIADKAYDMLSQTSEKPNENISEDWIARFISSSEDVSDEDIQNIWAKILADEIQHPKTYSLRTLEVLKNLSKYEAILFSNICHYIVGDDFIPNEDEYLMQSGLNYSDILTLDECGLINSSGTISKEIKVDAEETIILRNNKYILVGKTTNGICTINLLAYVLSKVGQELYKAIRKEEEESLFFDYAKMIKKRNPAVQISLHKINFFVGDSIDYNPSDIFEEQK